MTPAATRTDAGAEARKHRAILAASLGEWQVVHVPTPARPGYFEVGGAVRVDGDGAGAVVAIDGRGQPWDLDAEALARRMAACERVRGLALVDGAWRVAPLRCRLSVCPVCARARAARAAARWGPVLAVALADGARCWHWTLTQRAIAAEGGAVTVREWQRGWRGTRLDAVGAARAAAAVRTGAGDVPSPAAGEGLGSAYTRLRDAFRALRDDRGTRALAVRVMPAFHLGTEWTGAGRYLRCGCGWSGLDAATTGYRCPSCGASAERVPRRRYPRWHAHLHVLSCTPPGAHPTEADLLAFRAAWCERSGGTIGNQRVREVTPANGLREVLKYPFKPSDCTSAGRLEILAWTRGLHTQTPGGGWHRSSVAGRSEPWARWREHERKAVGARRLHWVQADGTRALWLGTPALGEHEWAIRDPDSPTGWHQWRADASRYTGELQAAGLVPVGALDDDDDDDG